MKHINKFSALISQRIIEDKRAYEEYKKNEHRLDLGITPELEYNKSGHEHYNTHAKWYSPFSSSLAEMKKDKR